MVLLSRNLQCLLMCLSIPLPTCQPFFASPLSEVVLMWCCLWGKRNFDLGWHDVHSQQLYDVWGPKLSQTCIWGTSAEGIVTEGDKCRKESERKREKGSENETLNKYWESSGFLTLMEKPFNHRQTIKFKSKWYCWVLIRLTTSNQTFRPNSIKCYSCHWFIPLLQFISFAFLSRWSYQSIYLSCAHSWYI